MGKKILFISSQNVFQPSSGVESRVNNVLKILQKENEVVIFAPKQKLLNKPKNYYGFEYSSRFKKLLDTRMIFKSIKISKIRRFDEIFATTLWASLNGLIISRKLGIPFIFDDHNVEFLRFKRTKNIIWPIIYLFELLICKMANKVICVSQVDKNYLVKYFRINPKNIEILENPVDTSIFYPNNKVKLIIRKELNIKDKEKFILFFGQLDYQPNVEALKIIANEIIPALNYKKSNYKIVVCGKGDGKGFLKNFKDSNFIFKGFVGKIQDYINACDVVIAPLKSGSGTRIKILEALACNKRVISTSIGAEGLKINKLLEVEDDWKKFVKKI